MYSVLYMYKYINLCTGPDPFRAKSLIISSVYIRISLIGALDSRTRSQIHLLHGNGLQVPAYQISTLSLERRDNYNRLENQVGS